MKIGEYTLIGELKGDNSGYARWGFAKKGRKEYFIKEFLSPVYPADDSPLAPELIERKKSICARFEQRKQALYSQLLRCSTGNVVVIEKFFRYHNKYYIVTEKVDSKSLAPVEIAESFTPEQKSILLKVLCYNVASLHENGIVHGDIKPNNVIIKRTKCAYTAKLIDFDSSFLETALPSSDELQGDMVYFSPEAFLRLANGDGLISRKMDVFSLGLLFHQYYTGNLPGFDTTKYSYAFEAVLDDAEVEIDPSIPYSIAEQIRLMLKKDAVVRPNLNEVFTALTNTVVSIAENLSGEKSGTVDDVPCKTVDSYFKKAGNDELM